MKRESIVAWIVIAGAAIARVFGAVRFPFEQDELYTIDEATNLFHTKLLPGIQARPAFFLLEHPFVTGLPTSEPWLRAVALVFGIAGLWAVWRLARTVMGSAGALFALVLVALSPWHLYASAFARYYSLLFLLAALVYWLLPRAYDRDEPRAYLAALVPMIFGAWTHPSFVFPVAGAVLAVTLVSHDGVVGWRWPSRTAWAWLYAPLVVLSVAIIGVIHFAYPSRTTVANGGDRGLLATLRLVPAMVDWMTLTVAVAALAGMVLLLRSRASGRRRAGVMALLASIFTVVALFVLSFKTAIYADYGIAALPLVLVAAAFPLEWITEGGEPARARAAAWALAAIVLSGVLPSAVSYLSDGTRFDYRPAYARITAVSPTTPVLTTPIAQQRRYAPALAARELPTDSVHLDSTLVARRDLWVVTSVKRYGIVGDDTGGMARWLSDHCRQVDTYQRPRLDYRIYRVDLWRCTLSDAGAAGTVPTT